MAAGSDAVAGTARRERCGWGLGRNISADGRDMKDFCTPYGVQVMSVTRSSPAVTRSLESSSGSITSMRSIL